MRHVRNDPRRDATTLEHVDLERRDARRVQTLGVERAAPVKARAAVDDDDHGGPLAIGHRNAKLADERGAAIERLRDVNLDALGPGGEARLGDRHARREGKQHCNGTPGRAYGGFVIS